MSLCRCMITVYFEDPFWVGLFEREDGDGYQVCKFPFGGEPKDYEVYDFLMRNWSRLVFSPKLSGEAPGRPTGAIPGGSGERLKRTSREVRLSELRRKRH